MKYFALVFLLMAGSQAALADKCVDLMQKEDFYAAADVCDKMARKGNKSAQFAMAVMNFQGSGMMNDMAKAQEWMRKAAEQNHIQAQYNLGIMLANGQGSEADLVEAYAWLAIAAENGYSAATEAIKQLGEELSSAEKKAATEKIEQLKKDLKP